MAKVFADKGFVGVWKCTTTVKEVVFNQTNLTFPDHFTKIVSFSNTPGGTIMYMGQPGPDAKGVQAARASGIAVEFLMQGPHGDKYILCETQRINIVDTANLLGESVLEWRLPGKGVAAKVITRNEYHRVGRMRS
jgi:hypothetical protein